ncbi:MAG: hypothetical protein P8I93_09740 [Crocinitomicaceae bacterium]|nr:hypothetical protein [Crocinitomicaceae bacterium]
MQQIYKQLFPELPDDSKIWIYSSDRILSEQESNYVMNNLQLFTQKKWNSHGSKVQAKGALINGLMIVLAVNENINIASGCSIDSSVHMIKNMGKEIEVDFFNRFYVCIQSETEIKRVHMNTLSDYKDYFIFDPLVQSLGDLRSNWLKPVSSHPLCSI